MHACVIACDYAYMCHRVRHCIKRACVCSHYCLPVFVEAFYGGVLSSRRPIMRQPPFGNPSNRCRVRVPRRSYVFPPAAEFHLSSFPSFLLSLLCGVCFNSCTVLHVSHSCATTSPKSLASPRVCRTVCCLRGEPLILCSAGPSCDVTTEA